MILYHRKSGTREAIAKCRRSSGQVGVDKTEGNRLDISEGHEWLLPQTARQQQPRLTFNSPIPFMVVQFPL